ncbi:MAG TPA: sugar transferase [Pirellulales bacterium]|jgi:lipopolysaccharide/colanic/teichoic acid biosynthesis glycosyltransferase|nr:sugar transferase [Pirellulales bacterium]
MNIETTKKVGWFGLNPKRGRRKDDRLTFDVSHTVQKAVSSRCVGPLRPRQPRTAGSTPGQIVAEGNESLVYLAVKRSFDLLGAVVLLVLTAPITLTTLLVLAVTTKGRPIFVQERVGLCGRRFRMFKFRSMSFDAAAKQHLVANEKDGPIFKNRRDPRITRIGAFLRSTSIDELPQLINVLLGHMSLVGPRPPVPGEVAKYQPWQLRRLAVKPGLTCLWQVSGRCEIGFDDWVRMDIWYLNNQNLATDLTLLAKTPMSVLSRRGAY